MKVKSCLQGVRYLWARGRDHRARGRDGGAVTVELAMVLPVLMATIVAGLWAVGIVISNIRCVDAARDTARAVARGESAETAQQLGLRAAPSGAAIEINREGADVSVVVTAKVDPKSAVFGGLPTVPITCHATVQAEPTETQAP
jgi:hypothetical protein